MAFQSGLFAFLFALPPLALLTAILSMASGTSPAAGLTALAIALPALAASLLSLYGSYRVRNLVIATGGLMLVLASASSHGATIAASSAAAVFALKLVLSKDVDWKIGLTCASLALCAASFHLAVSPAGTGPLSLIPALPLVLLAAAAANWRTIFAEAAAETGAERTSSLDIDPQVAAFAGHAGALIAVVAKNGLVAKVEGRASVEWLTPLALQGRGLVECVHIADRAGFLVWIGGLVASANDDVFEARLSPASANVASQWVKCSFRKIHSDKDDFLLAIVADTAGQSAGPNTNALAIGSLGHELRNPLNAILGFSEMVRDGFCGPLTNEKQIEYLDLIHRSSHHLLQVSNAMLDWSQLESGARTLNAELFMPSQSASLAIGIVSADARARGIGLDFHPACGMDEFCGDERALTQILINLLSNAIKFAPENGLIKMSVDIANDCLKLSVSDDGPGMHAVDRASAGMPVFQLIKAGSHKPAGAGLGLSIVRELARLHGGSMMIESNPSMGTCVKVAFPALKPKRSNIAEMRVAEPDESTRIIQIHEERGYATNRKTA